MRNIITLVLGGGRGTRLYPLTKYRSKPAVPLAGKFRLIDIPLSNCINSGLNRIYVLTQFNSVSLHRHIRRTYAFDQFSAGFVEILAAQQTLDTANWYQGTADAVRQNLRHIDQPDCERVLVLSGDQLYRMNFEQMVATHEKSRADVTIAGMPVDRQTARSMGLMRVDEQGRVVGFLEKPQTDREIDMVRMEPKWIDARGVDSRGRDCLASMGIYLFEREALVESVDQNRLSRFRPRNLPGRHALASRRRPPVRRLLGGHRHHSLVLRGEPGAGGRRTAVRSRLGCGAHLHARAFLAPTRIEGATIRSSLIADGCVIEEGATLETLRDRLAVPHRPRRRHSRLDSHGERRLRKGRTGGRGGGPSAGDRFGQRDRRRDHRQELPHRPQCPHHQRSRR